MTRLYQEGFKGTIWNTFAAKKANGSSTTSPHNT